MDICKLAPHLVLPRRISKWVGWIPYPMLAALVPITGGSGAHHRQQSLNAISPLLCLSSLLTSSVYWFSPAAGGIVILQSHFRPLIYHRDLHLEPSKLLPCYRSHDAGSQGEGERRGKIRKTSQSSPEPTQIRPASPHTFPSPMEVEWWFVRYGPGGGRGSLLPL